MAEELALGVLADGFGLHEHAGQPRMLLLHALDGQVVDAAPHDHGGKGVVAAATLDRRADRVFVHPEDVRQALIDCLLPLARQVSRHDRHQERRLVRRHDVA